MNKEYMVLSNGNVAVTDDIGHITIRAQETSVEDILFMENKKELIDQQINALDKELHEQLKVVTLSKWMMRISPIIALGVTLASFICGGLFVPGDFLSNAMIYGITSLVTASILCGAEMIYFSIAGPLYKNKAQITNESLETARKMKKEFEQELLSIKERNLEAEQSMTINEPVSLVEKTHQSEVDMYKILYKHDIEQLKGGELKLVRRKK